MTSSRATCACALLGPHFTCNTCGMHVGRNSVPCISCRGFRFTAFSPETPSTTDDSTAAEPMQTKPQPATHARRTRSART